MRYKPEDFIVELVADIYEDHKISDFGFDPIQLCKDMGHIVLPYNTKCPFTMDRIVRI